jgi:hypothetical protein
MSFILRGRSTFVPSFQNNRTSVGTDKDRQTLACACCMASPTNGNTRSLPFRTFHSKFCGIIVFHLRAICTTHYILLHLITLIIFSEGYKLRSSSLCSLLQLHATSSHSGPDILLSTLFSYTHGLYYSLRSGDQVSRPYKTADEIIFMYVLRFMFLGGTQNIVNRIVARITGG